MNASNLNQPATAGFGRPASAGSLWRMRETCQAPDKFMRYKKPWKLECIKGEKVHLSRTVEHEGLKIQWIDCTLAELGENFDEANDQTVPTAD